MARRRVVGMVIGFLMLCGLWGCSTNAHTSANPPLPVESARYHNAEYGFSIAFPSSWERLVAYKGNIVVGRNAGAPPDPDYHPSVYVQVEEFAEPKTVDHAVDVFVTKSMAAFEQFTVVDRSAVVVDGREARRIVYTATKDPRHYQSVAYFIPNKTKMYGVVGIATAGQYPQFVATFDAVAKTFRLE